MELIDVQPQEFLFHFGVTHTDLLKFKIILDNMEFNYDGKLPAHVAAKDYLENKLYPSILEAMKVVEDKDGS